ncbi:MAG: hypothetical protein ACM3UY_06195 [Methanocella sp.]|jgi:hypothetical protein
MIKLRIDVDYPYPSRAKSFLCVALRIKQKHTSDYLKNARIIAGMINESSQPVKAYWFFTPYTIPDKELLELLNSEKHEVALHVANNPIKEWNVLEEKTGRKVQYYTIHGTERLFARLLWGRKISQGQAIIPQDFPLISLHDFHTMSLDRDRYLYGYETAIKETREWIEQGIVMSMHPEWLFASTKKTKRGPFYDVLKTMLDVDRDLESLSDRNKFSLKIAHDVTEYTKSVNPTESFLNKLRLRNIDIFAFRERSWCCPIANPPKTWIKEEDNVGLLDIKDYAAWWSSIGKKTRNLVRKAQKEGITVSVVQPSDKLAEGIWRIYNETPIRQERAFTHYGETLQTVAANMYAEKQSTFIGAYLGDELAGFIQIQHGDNINILSNILSLQKHWDKAVNNALIAKAVEVCASRGDRWLMYGRFGNHPSLDRFKGNNGFKKFPINRYYIALTYKGRLAIKLRLHKETKDALPDSIKYRILPVFNWISRTKIKLKLWLKQKKPLPSEQQKS